MVTAMMKLVEDRSGTGELIRDGSVLRRVSYSLHLYQGFVEHSGLPIPGLHRLEGRIDLADAPAEWIGIPLGLKLEDGRVLSVTLVAADGRILSEGHGPSRCSCC
jgi:hypothetical protein